MDGKHSFTGPLNNDELVTITPDDKSQTIIVSKNVLCQTSDYFVKALNGEFKEASEDTLHLPRWDSNVIELFIFWAYHRTLPDFDDQIEEANDTDKIKNSAQKILISLWLFADAHLIPQLQSTAMRELSSLTSAWHMEPEVIRFGFETAPKDSPIRTFVLNEARMEYFCAEEGARMPLEELEKLVRVPGFLAEVLEPVRDLLGEGSTTGFERYGSADSAYGSA